MYGRVKRLLLDPLLLALKRKFEAAREDRMTRLVDFLLSFDYQLSGEVVMDVELLKRMRSASHWGLEIFTLIEAWRKAGPAAQVEITTGVFDHKHQAVSQDDPRTGLNRMAIDIAATLFKALIVDEGLDISNHFFRDLALVYTAVAEDLIKKYSENARFNGLAYDRDSEEFMVHQVFAKAVLYAGFILDSPRTVIDNLIRFVSTHGDFTPYLDQGFIQTANRVEKKLRQDVYWGCELPSWEIVLAKDPDFLKAVSDIVKRKIVGFRPIEIVFLVLLILIPPAVAPAQDRPEVNQVPVEPAPNAMETEPAGPDLDSLLNDMVKTRVRLDALKAVYEYRIPRKPFFQRRIGPDRGRPGGGDRFFPAARPHPAQPVLARPEEVFLAVNTNTLVMVGTRPRTRPGPSLFCCTAVIGNQRPKNQGTFKIF